LGYFHSVLIPFTLTYENHHVVRLPAERGIREIFVADPWAGVHERPPRKGCCAKKALDWMLERQEADGNWAGVFINTMFSLIALKSTEDPAYDEIIDRGMHGVDLFQNVDGDTMNQQFSQPPVMDSAYVLHLLLSAGLDADSPEMSQAAEWLRSKQTTIKGDWSVLNPDGEPGGWSFEHHNRYFPDVDCAVMVLDAFALLDGDDPAQSGTAEAMQRGVNWVVSMQNDDGGWAAWDKNALDIKELLPFLQDALWLPVDISWADVTARALLALADLGYPGEFGDPSAIPQGLAFLKSQQTDVGAWYGRWGVNYTYGTGQVLQALAALGESPDLPYVRRAINWLLSAQNPDGGWGEDPISYLDPSQAGVGESTVFQTAYVLIGLIAMGEADNPPVERGVRWLLDAQQADGSWFDEKFLGCNLPGYWYSRYDLLSTYKAAYALLAYDRAVGAE
jgi:squalene-hopene/tetraprenyl-beta-curcumene cyclase